MAKNTFINLIVDKTKLSATNVVTTTKKDGSKITFVGISSPDLIDGVDRALFAKPCEKDADHFVVTVNSLAEAKEYFQKKGE